jgi:hypothetical protein
MNTKPIIQNLLAERTENKENFNAKGYPKNPSMEDIFRKTQYESNFSNDNFAAPVDPFGNISFGFNDLEDNNTETSGLNVFNETKKMDDRREAVRKEYKMNNPDE